MLNNRLNFETYFNTLAAAGQEHDLSRTAAATISSTGVEAAAECSAPPRRSDPSAMRVEVSPSTGKKGL
jgi:hypothetical protein